MYLISKDYLKIKQSKLFRVTVSEKAQIASYEVSEMIAIKMKSHTLAESLTLPACKKMVKTMLGDDAEKQISKIPLSNDIVVLLEQHWSTNSFFSFPSLTSRTALW